MKKGKKIICPRCGKEGLLIQKPTVTKGHRYVKWYVAHYLPNSISKHGKIVNRIKWCYLNKQHIEELKAKGIITQNCYTNVTQNCVTENTPKSNCFSNLWWTGRDLNPRPRRCQRRDHSRLIYPPSWAAMLQKLTFR